MFGAAGAGASVVCGVESAVAAGGAGRFYEFGAAAGNAAAAARVLVVACGYFCASCCYAVFGGVDGEEVWKSSLTGIGWEVVAWCYGMRGVH